MRERIYESYKKPDGSAIEFKCITTLSREYEINVTHFDGFKETIYITGPRERVDFFIAKYEDMASVKSIDAFEVGLA